MMRVVEVILSDEKRIGKGTEDDPVRAVHQVYTLDGQMLCELTELLPGFQVNAWLSALRRDEE